MICFAVINGTDLYVAVEGQEQATGLVLVHRHRKEVRLLPPPAPANSAALNVPPGGLLAVCHRPDVLGADDTGTWDLALTLRDRSSVRPSVTEESQLYPVPPAAAMAADDGVLATPYRTGSGHAALRIDRAPPDAHVSTLVSEPGRLALTVQLHRWTGPEPTRLVLARRGGTDHVSAPLVLSDGGATVTAPLDRLADDHPDLAASVWDVAVEGPGGRVRVGRTAHDVADPRRVYRYATSTYSSGNGAALVFRPYFTKDRHLAVEIDSAPRRSGR